VSGVGPLTTGQKREASRQNADTRTLTPETFKTKPFPAVKVNRKWQDARKITAV
jgi:hypothetical protein